LQVAGPFGHSHALFPSRLLGQLFKVP